MTNERVYMCIRVLEDGERERATHFRVVDAGAYEEAIAEIARLKASAAEPKPPQVPNIESNDSGNRTGAWPTAEEAMAANYPALRAVRCPTCGNLQGFK